jgi:hypothetical protein
VVAVYEGVGAVSNKTIIGLLAETETWFMNSYNNKSYTRRARELLTKATKEATGRTGVVVSGGSFVRSLQQDGGGGGGSAAVNPADTGVELMKMQTRFISQQVTPNGLTVTYKQDMQWIQSDSSSTSYTANELASFPYKYGPTNDRYVTIVQAIPGFEGVTSPFPTPKFPAAPTPSPTAAPPTRNPSAPPPDSSSSLSIGAIIGIAVGGAAFLAILLYCIATTCCGGGGGRPDGSGSDKDSRMAAGSSSGGYQSAGGAYASVGPPPTRVSTGRDEVSAMDYPRDGLESTGDFQDQRCVRRVDRQRAAVRDFSFGTRRLKALLRSWFLCA